MLQTSLPQSLMTATGPTNQVLITTVALSWGFISHHEPIWCAKFSSYRKRLALLRYASSFHFINIHAHTQANTHARALTHTHTTWISCSESEIFYWTFPASTNIPLCIAYNYSTTLILQSHKLLISLQTTHHKNSHTGENISVHTLTIKEFIITTRVRIPNNALHSPVGHL